MARPTQAKDIKPDDIEADLAAEAGDGGGAKASALDLKFIITILAIFIAGIGGSVATTMFLAPMVLGPVIQEQVIAASGADPTAHGGEHGDEHGGGSHGGHPSQTIGMLLDLEEFTVNLKNDPTLRGNQFLRTKLSLSIALPEEEYCDPTGGGHHANAGTPGGMYASAPMGPSFVMAAIASPVLQASPNEPVIASGGSAPDPFVVCTQTFGKHMSPYTPTMRDIINQALMKRTAGTLATIEGQEMLKDEIKTQVNSLLGGHYAVIRVNFSDFIIQY